MKSLAGADSRDWLPGLVGRGTSMGASIIRGKESGGAGHEPMLHGSRAHRWGVVPEAFTRAVVALCLVLAWGCSHGTPGGGFSSSPRSAAGLQASARQSMEDGLDAYSRGALDLAVARWSEAATAYDALGQRGERCDVLVRLARAQQAMGLHAHAVHSLEEALPLARGLEDRARVATVLGSLGDVHIVVGPSERSSAYLREGLELARALDQPLLSASILNHLGNLHASLGEYERAGDFYLESASLARASQDPLLAGTALSNAGAAAWRSGSVPRANNLLAMSREQLRQAQPSHEKAFGLIGLGLTYLNLHEGQAASMGRSPSPPSGREGSAPGTGREGAAWLGSARELFREALEDARGLDDPRAASYAWGYLGTVLEEKHEYQEALQYTHHAMLAAQRASTPESLYRWQWQAGRILRALGDPVAALGAYREAGETIRSIRDELTRCYGLPARSFREVAGPFYLELVDLLLEHSESPDHAAVDPQPWLLEARDAVEQLKVYELRDYYHDECVDAARRGVTRLDVVSREAVIVYPVLLEHRLELLVGLPGGLKRYAVPVSRRDLTREVRSFRARLEKLSTREYLPHAQRLYHWLVEPVEGDLQGLSVESLVFVPDGPLRTIPMAALHDGRQFLIERYAIATTPGLDLTEPRPLPREGPRALAVGLTASVQGFPPLPHVLGELEAVTALFPGRQLVDSQFVLPRMAALLMSEPFTILHIASHGVFGGDVRDSFILTHDGRLTMDHLDEVVGLFRFRKDPLELLTLSACDTAAGDDRAALGLAGLAVRAGARSALATLWHINDQATSALVADFYGELRNPGVSRARALQLAQTALLKDRRHEHPGYWAPFLLINNWL